MHRNFDILPEVSEALKSGKAVVALESTIIFHGMPYPKNIECHERCESIIRKGGAVPAAIAVRDGSVKIGLTKEDIQAMLDGRDVAKLSRRDLPTVVGRGTSGATTVSATMILAEMAGISVFATGGIGGVHRGAQETFDISADLPQLAQSNVLVVCAGAKSILDIGLTLEYLETFGVPVLGYETPDFPAFYTQKSGYPADSAVNSPQEVASIMKAKWDMGIKGGILVACPVPSEHAMDEATITKAIDSALEEANAKGISGKASTPFLLSRVVDATQGKSLETNIQLVWNNCQKAAAIAVAYHTH